MVLMSTLEEEWQSVRKKATEIDVENPGNRALFYLGALAVISIIEPVVRSEGRYDAVQKLWELAEETMAFVKDYRAKD
jgi:hypothetical protein